ncbi:hypothetical protein CR513_18679, partial [Mucuna pruriens]
MKRLEDEIEKFGGGLESMRIDIRSVNARINVLSRGNEKEVQKSRRESKNSHDRGYQSYHSKSSRSQASKKMKVEQNLKCIDCDDMIKVKLIALSFEGYALIWWNEIFIQIRGMRRIHIESWDELKREIR